MNYKYEIKNTRGGGVKHKGFITVSSRKKVNGRKINAVLIT